MERLKTKHFEIINFQGKVTKKIIDDCMYAYDKNKRFFGGGTKFFKIFIAHNEKQFKKVAGRLYAPWAKGVARKGKKVVIRSTKAQKRCYSKYKGTRSVRITLIHELTHIFEFHLNVMKGPYWLTEAIAMHVAGQVPGKNYKCTFKFDKKRVRELIFYKCITKKACMEMYTVYYYALAYLLKRFGKKKLLRLIKLYSESMKKPDFEKRFEKVFRIPYKKFLRDYVVQFSY